jgi:hypothetical protein
MSDAGVVWCVRRFKTPSVPTELIRVIDLPLPPVAGMLLVFPDDSGEAPIAVVKVRVREWTPGVRDPDVTVICHSEPVERMAVAKSAGWKPVEG